MRSSAKSLLARVQVVAVAALILFALVCDGHAQTWPPAPLSPPNAPAPQEPVSVRKLPLNFLKDQGAIWSSPARVRERDFGYLIPLGLAVTVAISTDHQTMSDVVSHDKRFNNRNTTASNVLLSPFIAAPVLLFGAGQ